MRRKENLESSEFIIIAILCKQVLSFHFIVSTNCDHWRALQHWLSESESEKEREEKVANRATIRQLWQLILAGSGQKCSQMKLSWLNELDDELSFEYT